MGEAKIIRRTCGNTADLAAAWCSTSGWAAGAKARSGFWDSLRAVGHQNSGGSWNQRLQSHTKATSIGVMITALFAMLAYLRAFLIARHHLAMEAVALRQQ